MKHKALIELEQIDKNIISVREYVNKHLPIMQFHFFSVFGFPRELFEEVIKEKCSSLSDQLVMIIKFYQE